MDLTPIVEERKGIVLPMLKSEELEKICHSLIKRNGGYFGNRRFILARSKKGKSEIKDEVLLTDISKHIDSVDQAIIFQYWSIKKKHGVTWCYLFLLDHFGVRKTLKASWGWKRMKKVKVPFSKKNYNDTAFRRREQVFGEGKDMEFVYHGCKVTFVRSTVVTG